MLRLEDVQRKLTILHSYDKVFRGSPVRQLLPRCCGKQFDIGKLLQMEVKQITVEVEGDQVMMFEVVCPVCGRVVPPEWEIRKNGI
ncbi:hypothetical protein [Geobacter sp. SVR]|uniref:hypothetical protein n=1 Tax=Geobacter sp. SVR TaxID=2495594 RepID=UPI00143F01E0|nr:hypothetical protein [Geobacter sp. SVR]BCS52008.1 hypothetical protein GSVR_03160 [Geobacter sp. SVR]GCF87178.1 hypothetical protein GSbR_37780 [Geobacter sp. SVR]